MKAVVFPLWVLAFFVPAVQAADDTGNPSVVRREWTSTDGRKLNADFLGLKEGNVVIRLANGKVMTVPAEKFSAADNDFLREHGFDYQEPWSAWPLASKMAATYADVQEEKDDKGYVYTTPHFCFRTDANLGKALMKDLTHVFEQTYHLHSHSPFGILAQPKDNRYEARLFGVLNDYRRAGGLPNSAGVYLPKDKVFLAPLDLMGVERSRAGFRKKTGEYDPSTIVHELTHMLTHDMLENLPTWANEGYAEYISRIPIESKSFRTETGDIRKAVIELLEKELYCGGPSALFPISEVLSMNDKTWATGGPTSGYAPVQRSGDGANRMQRLYRTAHLIIYYFIHIEGEAGVAKIRRFIEENRRHLARYEAYENAHADYVKAMDAFFRLPGVKRLDDGRFEYPSNLTPPTAPEPPFTDPDVLKLGGLDTLLGNETAEVVGERIETAIQEHFDLALRFRGDDTGRAVPAPPRGFSPVRPPSP
ncbi:MAG: hypothetical protein H7A49_14760 [Akkermansiaceae bacterium]|nr:hypothetical protein [Akkermansiaceae bacterium]MCP5545154.1 hypothetical protein [Akkermansiaceae bacterium]